MTAITTKYNEIVGLLTAGDFNAAITVLGEHWQGPGVVPSQGELSDRDYAVLVMYCGVLTVELGLMGGRLQEQGKDMLSLSVRLLEDDVERVQIAQAWLAVAYERCGDFNEALALADCLLESKDSTLEVTVCAAKSKSIALDYLGRPEDALAALDDISAMVAAVPSVLVQGRYFLQRGKILRKLGRLDETRQSYNIANERFRDGKSPRYQAVVANNLAGVYMDLGDFPRAHVETEIAVRLFREIGDQNHEGMAWDQSAQVYRKEGKLFDAERSAQKSISLLEQGDHLDFLAEAYTTLGTILIEIGAGASEPLQKAAAIHEQKGNSVSLSSVNSLLSDSVVRTKRSAQDAVRSVERPIIERALEKHNWRVSPTAKELKLTHRGLSEKLKHQYPDLFAKIPPAKPRRKSIIPK